MPGQRTFIIAVALAALTVGGAAVPAVAAPGATLAIVNGIPGKNVEVCLGGQEIRHGLRYGAWFERSLAARTHKLQFRVATRGRCLGRLLASKRITLAAGADLTIVGTAFKPDRVVVFDNAAFGFLAPSVNQGYVPIRHAADVGPVTMHLNEGGNVITPAVSLSHHEKGDQSAHVYIGDPYDDSIQVWATFPGERRTIASAVVFADGFNRLEHILVGTKPGNLRFAQVYRAVVPAVG